MYYVYLLSLPNKKYYIGVTNNLKRRLNEHKRTKIIIAYNVIFESPSADEVYEFEKLLVSTNLVKEEYLVNQTRGGRHPFNMRLGKTHSEKTIKKISNSKKGKPSNISRKSREAASQRMRGEKNPAKRPEVREKLRFHSKINASRRKGLPGTMLGKKLTEEQHAKISYKIQTPDGIFASSVIAAKHHRVSQQTIINRCKSDNFTLWKILEKGIKY